MLVVGKFCWLLFSYIDRLIIKRQCKPLTESPATGHVSVQCAGPSPGPSLQLQLRKKFKGPIGNIICMEFENFKS